MHDLHAPTDRPTVSVIVPAMNEELNLPLVAARFPEGWVDEIILVDGHSKDRTIEVARELWPGCLIVQQTRKGKGNALACGFKVASGDLIVMLDADCSTDPAEIPDFVSALINGADYAKGSRFCSGGGSADITRWRRLGNYGLNTLVNAAFGAHFSDLCYGYNAFKRECLQAMRLPDTTLTEAQWGDGFEIETLINVRVARSGLRIAEVASFEEQRRFGYSNLNSARDGLRVLRTIIDEKRHGVAAGEMPAEFVTHAERTPSSEFVRDSQTVDARSENALPYCGDSDLVEPEGFAASRRARRATAEGSPRIGPAVVLRCELDGVGPGPHSQVFEDVQVPGEVAAAGE